MTMKKCSLLIAMFLLVGFVAMAPSALAQTQWVPGANGRAGGHCQGKAEATGQFTMEQLLGGTVGSGTYFSITYTQPVINLGSVTLQCSSQYAGNPWYGPPYPACSLASSGGLVTKLDSTREVLTITFTKTVVFPPTTSSVLAITVRVDATSECSAVGGAVQARVFAFSPNPVYSLTISGGGGNPSSYFTVLTVNPDPALKLGFGNWCSSDPPGEWHKSPCKPTSSAAYVLLCLGVISDVKQYSKYFVLNVAEAFTYALTSSAYEIAQDPGSTFPGTVTNPTEITVVLSGIPTGFGIAPGPPIPCSAVTAPATPCPSGTLVVGAPTGGPYWNSTPGNTGTETFEYPVENVDNGSPENVNLPFKIYSAGPILTSGLPCITATIYKDPEYGPTTMNDVPVYAPVAEGTMNVVCFNNCETNILWPYVIGAWGAWSTDIAISNTTLDPLAIIGASKTPPDILLEDGTATPQVGTCALFYYSGGALVDSWVVGPITAGMSYAFDFGATRPLAANSAGYIWGKCEFSQAYGYAAIEYNFGVSNAVLANYLAITIPNPEFIPRDTDGYGYGENANLPF